MYIAISGDVFNSGALTPKSTLEFTHLHTIVIHVVTSIQPVGKPMHIHPSWWKCFTNRTDPSANAIFEFIGFGRSAVLSKTLFVLKMIGDFLFVWKISQKFGQRIVGILTNNHNFVHRPINCPWYKIWHPLFLMFPYSSVITFKLVRDMTLKKI